METTGFLIALLYMLGRMIMHAVMFFYYCIRTANFEPESRIFVSRRRPIFIW